MAALVAESHSAQQCAANQRGATAGRRPNRSRRTAEANERLPNNYFVENFVYGAEHISRRFCMQRPLFLRALDAVQTADPYFQQRRDATGRFGLSALQKCAAALRQLAYGVPADADSV